jgi:uncharacterized protein (DUF433 family)
MAETNLISWTPQGNIPSIEPNYLMYKQSYQPLQSWFEEAQSLKPYSLSREEWLAERLRFAVIILRNSVDIDPEIRGGVPVLKNTRIPISQIIAEVADDSKISDIADDFNLDINILANLFEGIAIHLDRPFNR